MRYATQMNKVNNKIKMIVNSRLRPLAISHRNQYREFYLLWFHLLSSYLVAPYPTAVSYHLISSHSIQIHSIPFYFIRFYLVTFYLISLCLIKSDLISSHSRFILSYLTWPWSWPWSSRFSVIGNRHFKRAALILTASARAVRAFSKIEVLTILPMGCLRAWHDMT